MQNALIFTLTNAQIKSLRLHKFNAKAATSKSVAITALILYYNSVHNSASFMQRLTIANNIEQLEVALVRTRNSKHFCVNTYANAIKKLNTNSAIFETASAILCLQ